MQKAIFLFLSLTGSLTLFAGNIFTNGKVIPQPQKQVIKKKIKINPAEVKVETSSNPVKSLKLGKKFLDQKLKSLPASGNGVAIHLKVAKVNDKLWQNTPFANLKSLPAQGYQLKFDVTGDKLNIYAVGADNKGVFYALSTIIQLLYSENGETYINTGDISDNPVWLERYTGGYSPVPRRFYEKLPLYKISGYGIQHRYNWRLFAPEKRPKYYRKKTYQQAFEEIRKFRQDYGDLVDFMLLLNIYAGSKKQVIDISNSAEVDLVVKKCLWAAAYVQHIMLQVDDFAPKVKDKYILKHPGEKKMFKSAGDAHGYLVKKVYDAVKKQYPEVKISFCSAPYSLNGHSSTKPNNKEYLKDLANQMPDDVPVVWTGAAIETQNVTAESHEKYQELVSGKPLFLWDNSSNMSVKPLSIWNTKFFPGMEKKDNSIIYVNGHCFSFFWSWLFAVNANDYLWNPKQYDSSKSYGQAYFELKGEKIPQFISLTRKDVVALRYFLSRKEKLELSKKVLGREQDFKKHKLDFRKVKAFAKKIYDDSSRIIAEAEVPRLKKDFDLNSKGSEIIWNKIPALKLSSETQVLKYPASVKMAYTPEYIYLQFTSSYSQKPVKLVKLDRDAPQKNSPDAIIVGLQPPLRNQRAGWIRVDIAGSVYDNVQWKSLSFFNPETMINRKLMDKSWILELKIPIRKLKLLTWRNIRKNDAWRMNFIRTNKTDNEISSWSPVSGKRIENKKFFGKIKFK